MLKSSFRWRFLISLSFLVFSFAGCSGSLVTQANYDKINEGMSISEVEKILGKGQDSTPSVQQLGVPLGRTQNVPDIKAMIWRDGGRDITLMFVDDKLKKKSMNEQ